MLSNVFEIGNSDQSQKTEGSMPQLRMKGLFLSLALVFLGKAAHAEDCFNGPVPVPPEARGVITVPPGQAVRLTFTFNALWENMVFVCDALTGQRILVKGNYHRDRTDWVSPIDNTRSLTYYVVAFHKTVSPEARDAGSYPWWSSPLKISPDFRVDGHSRAFVRQYGFSDSGGMRFDNALVTAYFLGIVGARPEPRPLNMLAAVPARLH